MRVLTLGAQNGGTQQVQWDGLDQNGVPVKPGTYKYAVTAVDNNGNPITATTTSLVTVSGVQPNAGQSASLLAGDQVVDPSTIVEIH